MHRLIKAGWGWNSSAKEKERIWFCRIETKLWGKDEVFHEVEVSLLFSQLSCVWLFVTLWTIVWQAPLSMGFSRQKYWSGLPFPSPGDLPDSGIKLASPASPGLTGGFFISWATGLKAMEDGTLGIRLLGSFPLPAAVTLINLYSSATRC